MEETIATKSIDELRAEMAAILGLDEPVNEAVFRAAIEDPTYAQHLLVCRGDAEFLSRLLANPPRPHPQPFAPPKSAASLARTAAESLLRWAKTGFSTVPDAVLRRRLSACRACPHLRTPPEDQRRLYAMAGAEAGQPGVCDQCGCVVTVKARRPGDTCPDPDPDHAGLNRWGEPLAVTP